jgi:hypothetical protein
MRDALHDKVDAREKLVNETTASVERIVRQGFADVFEGAGGDIRKTMEALAVLVEDELTDLTTEAVKMGADGARKARGSR